MKPSRANDLRATGVIVIFVLGIVVLGGYLVIERGFEPQDGFFGLPHRIPTCGRSYVAGDRPVRLPLAQIEATINPGAEPVILEPTIGMLPLTAPFEGHSVRLESGEIVCHTVVYLHVGPDAYAPYGLEGGP
ncbi:MAG TPA: hypothetical protein VFP19_09155 [Candidatus Limnocylindrales bacterium]|nr:hypothetical protein [Candidatus Limnocylindrales bacterium]